MNRWIRLFVVALASTVLLAPDCGKKKSSSSSSSSSTTTAQQQEASDDTESGSSASAGVADTTAEVSRSVASGAGKPKAIGTLTCPQFSRTGTLTSGTITLTGGSSGCTSVLTGFTYSGTATFAYTFDDPTDTVTLSQTFTNYTVVQGANTYSYNGTAASTATVATDGTCTMTITFTNLTACVNGLCCTMNGQYTAVSNVDGSGNTTSIILNGCVTFSSTTDSVTDTICFQDTTCADPSCFCPTAGAATWTSGDSSGSVTVSATFNGCGSATYCVGSACATVTQDPSECFLFPVP